MHILGINTATSYLSLAIIEKTSVLADFTYSTNESQCEQLVPITEFLLKQCALTIKDIEGIAVVVGPGGFTGLRIGVTTAKSLCQSLRIPLIGLSTLEVMAHQVGEVEGLILPILYGPHETINMALFRFKDGQCQCLTANLMMVRHQLAQKLSRAQKLIYLVEEGDMLFKNIVELNSNTPIRRISRTISSGSALSVAQLGFRKIENKEVDDYLTLTPFYSHQPKLRKYQKL